MKKVLIIGHLWPYNPGGSKRVFGLAKYLPEFGWEPIILTGIPREEPDPEFRVISTSSPNAIVEFKKILHLNPNKGIQEQVGIPPMVIHRQGSITTKIMKLFEEVITYPDVESGWKPFAVNAVRNLFTLENISALISVWPITAHLIAKELKCKFKIPWIADFPDLWSETYAYSYGPVRKWFDRNLEKKTLRLADTLTTSSWPQTEVLKKMHGRDDIYTITIGFDPSKINDPSACLTKEFTITYTGIFYGRYRNPSKFFQALSELLRSNLIDPYDMLVRFYGHREKAVELEIEKFKLSHVIKQYGTVAWEECLWKQWESQVLLQLNWECKEEKGAYSGKIAEYLAARRPVLCVGGFGKDVMEELIRDTRIGEYCPSVEETKKALLNYYKEYKITGKVSFTGDVLKIDKYSCREMARRFAGLLDSVALRS